MCVTKSIIYLLLDRVFLWTTSKLRMWRLIIIIILYKMFLQKILESSNNCSFMFPENSTGATSSNKKWVGDSNKICNKLTIFCCYQLILHVSIVVIFICVNISRLFTLVVTYMFPSLLHLGLKLDVILAFKMLDKHHIGISIFEYMLSM